MRISDWSSDVCSSDVGALPLAGHGIDEDRLVRTPRPRLAEAVPHRLQRRALFGGQILRIDHHHVGQPLVVEARRIDRLRSEEHTSELQSLMRISYAVFCLKKKNQYTRVMQQR